MLMLKFAVVTCAFYLGIVLLMEAGVLVVARFDMVGVVAPRWGWIALFGVVFGVVWLISFLLAYRIVVSPFIAGIFK